MYWFERATRFMFTPLPHLYQNSSNHGMKMWDDNSVSTATSLDTVQQAHKEFTELLQISKCIVDCDIIV